MVLADATWAVVAFGPADIPRLDTTVLDLRVLVFAVGVSFLTGIAFGLAPAVQASAPELNRGLRESERGSTAGAGRHRLRRLLMASEVALALVLLVGAGLMIRTFVALRGVDPGFRPDHVLTAVVSVTGSTAAAPGRRLAFYRDVLERVRAMPGIVSAGAINHLPLAGDVWGSRSQWRAARDRPPDSPHATFRAVLPGYFETMQLPVVRGRDFTDRDALARRVWSSSTNGWPGATGRVRTPSAAGSRSTT